VGGLTNFEIVGITGGAVVFAAWDGRSLIVSEELYESALLGLAWERLLDATGEAQAAASALDDPTSVALRLVRSLEQIVRIEYSTRCDRSQQIRTWCFDAEQDRRPSVVVGS
jgi:hypothetical protein